MVYECPPKVFGICDEENYLHRFRVVIEFDRDVWKLRIIYLEEGTVECSFKYQLYDFDDRTNEKFLVMEGNVFYKNMTSYFRAEGQNRPKRFNEIQLNLKMTIPCRNSVSLLMYIEQNYLKVVQILDEIQ